ncbi:MAG: sigma-70 family RNA polymerase sigma factor [Myxococcota bacterium]
MADSQPPAVEGPSARAQLDTELWTRWADGDDDAGNSLVRHYFPAVFRFFDRRVATRAEELTQATFLACVEHRERFRGDSTVRSYIFGVARIQLLRHLSGRGVDAASLVSHVSIDDIRTTPSARIDREHARAALQDAMGGLTTDQQMLIELHYWQGLSLAELAAVFDTPRGTFKSRLSRARDVLRKQLQASGADAIIDAVLGSP